jgi:GH25 family lysozyme M1 (1,4-beta-N-acetylmuramidase)
MILGVDISHFQGSPNFAQVKASGRSFVVLKATESTNFVDITCNGGYDVLRKVQVPSNRAAAHAAGLIVGLYHFARAGNPATEAAWFVHSVGTLQPGEFLVLDWEVPAADPVGWCRAWLAAVTAATSVKPLIYMNSTAMNGSNWTPITSDFGLWLAKYDSATVQPAVKWWPAAAMKQFSDRGSVPGIAGGCDVNVFYGTTAQLLAYGKGGVAPTPPTVSTGDPEMRVLRDSNGTVWLATDTDVTPAASQAASTAAQKAWGGLVDVTTADVAALQADAAARRARAEGTLVGYGTRVEGIQNEVQGKAPGTLNADLRSDLSAKQAQLDALAAAVASLSGSVPPTDVRAVVSGVLGGLDGASLKVTPPSQS